MIIRSFSKHLEDQNWFGLFLDFVVVVLGIFLGLQVADWNQARLDRQEAVYHLNFLYEELSEAVVSAEEEIEKSQEVLRDSFHASMLLSKDDWTATDRDRFQELVSATYQLWGPKHRPVSLRRMIDDGKLDLIESKSVQRAILRFDTAYLDAIEQTKTSYGFSLELTPKITAAMRFRGPEIVSSAEELLSGQTLRAAVRDKAIWQRIQIDVLDELQAARGDLKKFLEENVVLTNVRYQSPP